MKPIAYVVVVALSLSALPAMSVTGTAPARTANKSNCFFVRNHLPCPCPNARQAVAVAHAARITAGAIGTAIGTTATALARAETPPPAAHRNASQAPAKR